ncbi:ATP-dependent Clp protease ATP-binding subunit ClpX [Candidatus Gastranaerophilus sp. (ex Termes propinquus)]|nr:ATP-dependent Clp protease ATP-binding subunit ClpX [Candidatus Gastranaerophilus sp. (ex Termes propinquus)]
MNMDKKVVSIGSKSKRTKEKEEKEKAKPGDVEYCSFCNRPNTVVPKLVKGPGVNICSECTLIAVQYLILQDGLMSGEAQKILDLLWGENQ